MSNEASINRKQLVGPEKGSIPRPNPFWDFWGPIILTLSLYSGIRHYVAEARYIPSGSMLPGLKIQDRILVEKLSFKRRSPRRGDIVVFNSPNSFDKELIAARGSNLPSGFKCLFLTFPWFSFIPGLGDPACDAYIKRVVAIPGDEVFVDSRGRVFIEGVLLDEDYVSDYCPVGKNGFSNCKIVKGKVPPGHVLVLGDNRGNSWDGRFWPGGSFLPQSEILGRAHWRFWPIKRIGNL